MADNDTHEALDDFSVKTSAPAPDRSKGNTNLDDIESYISFVNQEMTLATRIYYKNGTFMAVFNDNFMDQPGWRDHTAAFSCEMDVIDQARASIQEGTGLPILNGSI
jgi:uncharacterized protein YfdQ (DUF2303 family)